jgi:hypothetical protein
MELITIYDIASVTDHNEPTQIKTLFLLANIIHTKTDKFSRFYHLNRN